MNQINIMILHGLKIATETQIYLCFYGRTINSKIVMEKVNQHTVNNLIKKKMHQETPFVNISSKTIYLYSVTTIILVTTIIQKKI